MQEMQETWVWSLSQEYPLEEEMETHSSILAWKIPWRSLAGCSPWSLSAKVRQEHGGFFYSFTSSPIPKNIL